MRVGIADLRLIHDLRHIAHVQCWIKRKHLLGGDALRGDAVALYDQVGRMVVGSSEVTPAARSGTACARWKGGTHH